MPGFDQKFVDSLRSGGEPRVVRDPETAGLMIVVGKKGASFKIQYDLYQNRALVRTVNKVITRISEGTKLKAVRRQARALLDQIRAGVDPFKSADKPDDSGVPTVETMFLEHAAHLRDHKHAPERTIKDLKYRREKYLGDWLQTPVTAITGKMCKERHTKITASGPRIANQVFRDFRAAYNLLLKTADDELNLPAKNPAKKVSFNAENDRREESVWDLPRWWSRLQQVESPNRRAMIELTLFGGLRPGTAARLERKWVDLEKRVVCIQPPPGLRANKRLKNREFHLPLSMHMVAVIKTALETSKQLQPDSIYLFPSRSDKTGEATHAQTWDDSHLPGETGHILRHTYKSLANGAGVSDFDSEILLGHKVPGISGTYLDIRHPEVFGRYLGIQERVSQFILARCKPTALAIAAE